MDAFAKRKYRELMKLLNEKDSPLDEAFEKTELMNYLNEVLSSDGDAGEEGKYGGEGSGGGLQQEPSTGKGKEAGAME